MLPTPTNRNIVKYIGPFDPGGDQPGLMRPCPDPVPAAFQSSIPRSTAATASTLKMSPSRLPDTPHVAQRGVVVDQQIPRLQLIARARTPLGDEHLG